ncbi:MAG: HAD family hydrolase [Firmicutes bacterium]|nr:HAD family hydrolase [Bacillota bacterium]
MQVRTVFFDLDATLWPPHSVALPAFRQVLEELGQPVPRDEVLLSTLGYPTEEIWQELLPSASDRLRQQAKRLMEQVEVDLLKQGRAQPFPGVKSTLQRLQAAGITLCILSNCDRQYLQAVPDALGIGHLFSARFCAADFPGLTKSQILNRVLPRFSQPAAMVGDRWHDIEAGKDNRLLTIGCAFGLGNDQELAAADHRIEQFSQLEQILM